MHCLFVKVMIPVECVRKLNVKISMVKETVKDEMFKSDKIAKGEMEMC